MEFKTECFSVKGSDSTASVGLRQARTWIQASSWDILTAKPLFLQPVTNHVPLMGVKIGNLLLYRLN